MNRGYTVNEYLQKVERLKQVCPDIRLTTDIIVGFPGESEEDFQATLELVARVRYADAFTFLYSPRSGTAAAELQDDQSSVQKQQRFERLLDLQNRIGEETWQSDLGRVLPVLVEGESKQGDGQIFGRTTWNRIVNFSGDKELIGQTVPVRISRVFRNSNLGELTTAV
jgi:tRNA-2-methylthio-N6-dimethylallyladenosine synthase